MSDGFSRRRLIHAVGRAGGVAAAYRTMAAMGLLAVPAANAGPPDLPPGSGAGTTVVILGAGIAGMVAALELRRAGYACVVLEARPRVGGRNWSLRGGDTVEEVAGTQAVDWPAAPHLYLNPGPARLPYHHQGILSYCRQLGVPLEVLSNDNRGALAQDDGSFGGAPQRNRAVVDAIRGAVAEMAAKAVDQAALDAPVTDADREQLRDMLRQFGALDRDLVYRGSFRAGPDPAPAAGMQDGARTAPLDLRTLISAPLWSIPGTFAESWDQAATMMQPVGGMGRIGEAFGRALGGVITLNAEVTRLRREGEGARVEWRDRVDASTHAIAARFVLCTLPAPLARRLDTDFPPAIASALAAPYYVPAGKIAWYAPRRFWEQDERIYGGISWTSRDITQIWYPSHGIHASDGILLGAYIWSDRIGRAFAASAPDARASRALDDLVRLHPAARPVVSRPVSVAWPAIPFSMGGWAEWSAAGRRNAYPALLAGEGPYLFAGEHVSWITGWQEGAVLSAQEAVRRIAGR